LLYFALHCIALHCIALHCIALRCSITAAYSITTVATSQHIAHYLNLEITKQLQFVILTVTEGVLP